MSDQSEPTLPLRRFVLEGRVVVMARDIDDAFDQLAQHFAALAADTDELRTDLGTDFRLEADPERQRDFGLPWPVRERTTS